MTSLAGKRALVTGAASGIGRAVAGLLSERGASVCMADINGDLVAKAAVDVPNSVAITCDVSSTSDVQAAVRHAMESFGALDIVVNNAGIEVVAPFLELDEEDFDRVLAVNLRGVFLGIKYGGRALAASDGGVIINTSSLAGLGGIPLMAAYGASKMGVVSLTQTAALELRAVNIRVNAVCPGLIQTPMVEAAGPRFEATTGMSLNDVAVQFQGRMGLPRDIASAVAFLASDEATLISGVALPVDGGISCKGM